MTTNIRTVRFERLPVYDVRACNGCGDDACVPTDAYIDNVTGRLEYCFPGDVPAEEGPVHDPRQEAFAFLDAASLLDQAFDDLADDLGLIRRYWLTSSE